MKERRPTSRGEDEDRSASVGRVEGVDVFLPLRLRSVSIQSEERDSLSIEPVGHCRKRTSVRNWELHESKRADGLLTDIESNDKL